MEEKDEKMAALKRAYADIILNTAKESAARVLAAERRALGFQHSLFTAKEDAIAAMLRLKALMENKIREAEKAASFQVKKIEELELQLGEAEDTIVDLREELKRVKEELVMTKNGSIQPLTEGIINDLCMACNNMLKRTSTDNLHEEPRNMAIISNNWTTSSQKTENSHQCCLQSGNTDLESIWNKVPEPCRKGYTQRIHALDHNLTLKEPFHERNDLEASSKSEQIPCSKMKVQNLCQTDSARLCKRTAQVKDSSLIEENVQQPGDYKTLDSGPEPCCSHGFSPKKQRTLYIQSNVFSDVFSDKDSPCLGNSEFSLSEEAPKDTPFAHVATEFDVVGEGEQSLVNSSTEKETLMLNQNRLDISIKAESFGIKQCTERIHCRNAQNKNPYVCEDTLFQNSLWDCDDVKDPLSRPFSLMGDHSFSEAIETDLERMEVAEVYRLETENVAENSGNCDAVELDSRDIESGSAQTGTDKFLKYTFQRKRKKESSQMKNEVFFSEKKSTLKSKSVDKQTSLSEPSKSSTVADTPRNNRRLVQVARQLISLSEKRW